MKKENIINLVLMLVVGMIGGLIAVYSYFALNSKLFSPVSINKIEEKTYIQENVALEQGVENAEDSLVYIKNGKGVFTGIVLTNDGLVATATSNLQSGSQIFLSPGEPISYNTIKEDSATGLTIIKIKKNQLKPVEFFDFDKIKIGKTIYSISITGDNSSTISYSANEGIIKSIDDTIKTTIIEDIDISGSPIFDIENRLIGLANKDAKGNILIVPSTKIKSLAGLN
jgi:hypothetical protein